MSVHEEIEGLDRQIQTAVQEALSRLREGLSSRLSEAHQELLQRVEGFEVELPAALIDRGRIETIVSGAGTDGRGSALRGVKEAIDSIDAASTQAEILESLLQGSFRFASRCALFLTRDDGAQGWGGKGFGDAGGALQGLRMPYAEEEGAWKRLSEGRGWIEMESAERAALGSGLETTVPEEAILIPLVLRNQVAAALYADRLEDKPALDHDALQTLSYVAALAIEGLPLRDRPSTPTLHRDKDAGDKGPGLGPWAAAGTAAATSAKDAMAGAVDERAEAPPEAGAVQRPAPMQEQAPEPAPVEAAPEAPVQKEAEAETEIAAEEVADPTPGPEPPIGAEPENLDSEAEPEQPIIEIREEPPPLYGQPPATPEVTEPPAVDGTTTGTEGPVTIPREGPDTVATAPEEDAPAVDPPAQPAVEAAVEAPSEAATTYWSPEAAAKEIAGEREEAGEAPAQGYMPPSLDNDDTADLGDEETHPGGFGPVAKPASPPQRPVGAAGSALVLPPRDVQGPGWAFTGSPASPEPDLEEGHDEAKRLARLLISEIKLYNRESVEEGRRKRDIYQRFKEDIDRSRQHYDSQVEPEVLKSTDYFQEELVRLLGGGDPDTLGM